MIDLVPGRQLELKKKKKSLKKLKGDGLVVLLIHLSI